MRKAKIKRNFDGYGEPVELEVIREYLFDPGNYGTTLFTSDKIIYLNIRFGEMYHKCTDEEWDDILTFIKEKMEIEEPFFVRLKQRIRKIFWK